VGWKARAGERSHNHTERTAGTGSRSREKTGSRRETRRVDRKEKRTEKRTGRKKENGTMDK